MALRPVTHSHPCRNYPPVMGRAAPAAAVYRASPNSADPFDSRDSVPGFADSVAADYSSPAVDLASVDLGSVAGRFVIAVAAAADPVAGLSFDPSCFADFSAALAVVVPDVSSVSRSFF